MAGKDIDLADIFFQSIWIIMALVLVGSSLALRELPKGSLLKLIALWVLIFSVVSLIVYAFQAL